MGNAFDLKCLLPYAHCCSRITSGHPHLAKWRLLFLVEGLPTICMAPVAYFFLPDTPDKARFFTEEEKVGERLLRETFDTNAPKLIAKARGVRQVGGVERVGGIVWKEVGLALLDLKCWFTAVSNILEFIGFLTAMALRLLSPLFQRLMWYSSCTSAATLASRRFPVDTSISIDFHWR